MRNSESLAFAVSSAIALAGCSIHGAAPGVLPSSLETTRLVRPDVGQVGHGAQWRQFNERTFGQVLVGMAVGPDGNIWYLDENGGGLVRVGTSGAIKEFAVNGIVANSGYAMAVGADKKFYVTYQSTKIARINTHGVGSGFAIPSGDTTAAGGIAPGRDGNVWFTEASHIGKINTSGKITEYSYPTLPNTNLYGGITAGPDGNMWFGESTTNQIGKIDPSTGAITEYNIPSSCGPAAIVSAIDGNIWFGCLANPPAVGRVTTAGVVTLYNICYPESGNYTSQFGARGPDGEPWFASANGMVIYKVDTVTHTSTAFTPPDSSERPDALVAGPDGNLWVDTIRTGRIDVRIFNPLIVTPTNVTLTGPGQSHTLTVSQHGTSNWTATTSNAAVATVGQGSPSSQFVVTGIGAGSCKVTIADNIHNYVKVSVTVL